MENQSCQLSFWGQMRSRIPHLNPAAFLQMLQDNPQVSLLDVRTSEEFSKGCLPSAKNLDYLSDSFIDDLLSLPADKTYLVYCRSGRRSLRVCTLMVNSCFSRVYNLDGGLNNLEHASGFII